MGKACRAVLNATFRATLTWVVQQVREHGEDADHVFAKLQLTQFAEAQLEIALKASGKQWNLLSETPHGC
jgi:hypothetical protein